MTTSNPAQGASSRASTADYNPYQGALVWLTIICTVAGLPCVVMNVSLGGHLTPTQVVGIVLLGLAAFTFVVWLAVSALLWRRP